MVSQNVQILIGMIGSGKSSYARNAAKKGYITINDDATVETVHGGDYTLYDHKCQPIYKSLSVNTLIQALSIGKSVIVDVGNRTRTVRQRWISLAHMFDVPAYAIKFKQEEPEVHARRRYDHDPRGYTYEKWLTVARAHADVFQSVREEEGFKDIIDITWEQIKDGYTFLH